MKLICFTLICILGCVSAQSSLGFMSVAGPGTQTPPVDIVTFVEATDADGRTWPASFSVPSNLTINITAFNTAPIPDGGDEGEAVLFYDATPDSGPTPPQKLAKWPMCDEQVVDVWMGVNGDVGQIGFPSLCGPQWQSVMQPGGAYNINFSAWSTLGNVVPVGQAGSLHLQLFAANKASIMHVVIVVARKS